MLIKCWVRGGRGPGGYGGKRTRKKAEKLTGKSGHVLKTRATLSLLPSLPQSGAGFQVCLWPTRGSKLGVAIVHLAVSGLFKLQD